MSALKRFVPLMAALGVLFLLSGCVTCPKHSMELLTEGEHNGILSVNGKVVTVYGTGSGRNPSLAGMLFDTNHEKDSRERALPESKNELKNGINRFFDFAADTFNNKYPDKKITGDALDLLKKTTAERAAADSKAFFYCYCEGNYIATYVETYEINIDDLKLPPEEADIFVSTASALIRPASEEARVLVEEQQAAAVTTPAQAAGGKNNEINGKTEGLSENTNTAAGTGTNADNSGSGSQSAEPFWAKDMDGNNYDYKYGVVSVEDNVITIFGGGVMIRKPETSNNIAKIQAGKCLDYIVNNTISGYLKLYPSGQPDCDLFQTASRGLSGDISKQSVLIGLWKKQEQVLLSAVPVYYSMVVYKFNVDTLKIPQKMKDVMLSEAQKAVCPYSADIGVLIKNPQLNAETAPTESDNVMGIIAASGATLIALILIFFAFHSSFNYL
jgi:hypothetical protein